jgi:hypothetical protein
MARAAGKKQAPAKVEEDDDDNWDDAVVEADAKDGDADLRLRDWRDVERFREMKELRSLVDDDYGLEEIFHVPLKPRGDPGRARLVPPAKPAPGNARAAPPAPAKGAAKAPPPREAPKAHAKQAPGSARAHTKGPAAKPAAKPAPKAKAKAKRK